MFSPLRIQLETNSGGVKEVRPSALASDRKAPFLVGEIGIGADPLVVENYIQQ